VIRFLADEDFNNDLVRGLLRRCPAANVVRVQDVHLRGATDDVVLAWAASEGRIVLTHDLSTLIARAYERVRASEPMPGVIAVAQALSAGQVIDDPPKYSWSSTRSCCPSMLSTLLSVAGRSRVTSWTGAKRREASVVDGLRRTAVRGKRSVTP
jgi:hypothetical protein